MGTKTFVALQIAEALKTEMRERAPVPVLKKQLLTLQADLSSAHERLHTTQVLTPSRKWAVGICLSWPGQACPSRAQSCVKAHALPQFDLPRSDLRRIWHG